MMFPKGLLQQAALAQFRRLEPRAAFSTEENNYLLCISDFMHWMLANEQLSFIDHEVGATSNYEGDRSISTPMLGDVKVLSFSHSHVAHRNDEFVLTTMRDDVPCYIWVTHVGDKGNVRCVGGPGADVSLTEAQVQGIFNLANIIALLPSYIQDARYEIVEPKPQGSVMARAFPKKAKRLGMQVKYKVICAVRKIYTSTGMRLHRAEPDHKVYVDGFWRRVTGTGRGPDGSITQGRTWVKGHSRWNQKPDLGPSRTVWVKEALGEEGMRQY